MFQRGVLLRLQYTPISVGHVDIPVKGTPGFLIYFCKKYTLLLDQADEFEIVSKPVIWLHQSCSDGDVANGRVIGAKQTQERRLSFVCGDTCLQTFHTQCFTFPQN